MDIKKNNVPNNTVTRKLTDIDAQTGNIYESVVVISRRANQIATQLKQELNRKLADFSSTTDTLEETFENREQIEISRYYERLPKPTLIATEEFLEGEVYFRNATPQSSSNRRLREPAEERTLCRRAAESTECTLRRPFGTVP